MMHLLQDPPPGYEGIARAFAMARQLPNSHRLGVTLGLARDGMLVARGELDGYRQVSFFRHHMLGLGWQEHLLGSDDEMFGCDMLFSLPPQRAVVEDEPSFIRRPAVQLWPAGTGSPDRSPPDPVR